MKHIGKIIAALMTLLLILSACSPPADPASPTGAPADATHVTATDAPEEYPTVSPSERPSAAATEEQSGSPTAGPQETPSESTEGQSTGAPTPTKAPDATPTPEPEPTNTPDPGLSIPTSSAELFEFELLSNGTYSIKQKAGKTLPEELILPIRCNGKKVTEVASEGFKGRNEIKKVTILDDYVSLGDSAFYGCENLETVIIADSVFDTGNKTFYGCKKLSSVDLPGKISYIGLQAFYGCTSLEVIELPSGLTGIWYGAFEGSGIEAITLPDGVNLIEGHAFSGCAGLKEVNFGKSSVKFTSYPFPDSEITKVTLDNIGQFCILDMTAGNFPQSAEYYIGGRPASEITAVDVPEGIEVLSCSLGVFTSLKELSLPASLTYIIDTSLRGCSGSLESITVAEGNAEYMSSGNCLIAKGNGLVILGCKNSVIPSVAAAINCFAFDGCTGLTIIEIPDSVTAIYDYAFYNCTELETAVIPDGTEVAENAFYGCTKLQG